MTRQGMTKPEGERDELASTAGLSTLHTMRMRMYQDLAEILGRCAGWLPHAPITDDDVPVKSSAYRAAPLIRKLRRRFQQRYGDDPVAASEQLVGFRCVPLFTPVRDEAWRALGMVVRDDPTLELALLALLARLTADALKSGDFLQACAIHDLQVRFLHYHGRACIGAFARQLVPRGDFLAELGTALKILLEDDIQLLSTRGAPRRMGDPTEEATPVPWVRLSPQHLELASRLNLILPRA